MSNIPNFDYLLVMPSGNVRGFEDIESAKGYVNNYYYKKTISTDVIGAYKDLIEDFDDISDVLSYKSGVEEGECRLYNTCNIIEKIQSEGICQEEKEELISKLLSNKIDINIYDYGIDNIFTNSDSTDIMEPYGEYTKG